MPSLSEILEKVFGQGIATKLQKRADPQGIMGARTPSFVPESVGKEIGAKFGGTLPSPHSLGGALSTPAATGGTSPLATRPRITAEAPSAAPPASFSQSPPSSRTRYADNIDQARYEYMDGNAPIKRNWKDALKNIALGALQGGATGGVGGALGGAATAGIVGAASPRMGREYQFNTMQMPRLLQQEQRADQRSQRDWQEQQRQSQLKDAAQRRELQGAQIQNYGSLERDRTADNEANLKKIAIQDRLAAIREQLSRNPNYSQVKSIADADGKSYIEALDTKSGDIIRWGEDGQELGRTKRAAAAIASREKTAAEAEAGRQRRFEGVSGNTAANNATKKDIAATKGTGGATSKAGALKYKEWAAQRTIANDESKPPEVRSAAHNQMQVAARDLAANHTGEYNVSEGQGGWSWVEPKKVSGGGTATGKVFSAAKLDAYAKEHNATVEQARKYLEAQGYTIQ